MSILTIDPFFIEPYYSTYILAEAPATDELVHPRVSRRRSTSSPHRAPAKARAAAPETPAGESAPVADGAQPSTTDAPAAETAATTSPATPTKKAAPVRQAWFTPAVDVYADASAFTIEVELPGVRKEDVSVTVEDDRLTISGERKVEPAGARQQYRRERPYGRFERTFQLPKDAQPEAISASHADGVLTITVPKRPEAERAPRKIAVA